MSTTVRQSDGSTATFEDAPPARWTEGPWDYHIGQDYAKIEDADGRCLVEMRLTDDGKCEADAQLMAAAPELARALLAIQAAMPEAVATVNKQGAAFPSSLAVAVERAGHALRKAGAL